MYPPLLALGIIVLAGLGFPASPLMLLCGAVWGSFLHPVWVVFFGVSSLYLAAIWTYLVCYQLPEVWLEKIPLVRPISLRERFLSKSENVWAFLFVLRFTPGIPFALPNIASGVLKIPPFPYFVMSFLSSLTAGAAIILLGDAIVSGQARLVILAVVLMVIVAFAVRKLLALRGEGSQKDKLGV